jgi:hypothetical protein
VAANAATLTAGIGTGYLVKNNRPFGITTAAGCATVASPTAATWTVDYSQQSTPISLTGLTSSGANAIILTSAATKAMTGNGIQTTGGTNFTLGVYSISSVVAGVSITVDRNDTTGVGAAGTAGVGGAFATPGMAGSIKVASADVFIKAGTYTCTSQTANVAGGVVSDTTGGATTSVSDWVGYNTTRILDCTDSTQPTISAGTLGAGTYTMVAGSGNYTRFQNLTVDCASQGTTTAIAYTGAFQCTANLCNVKNFTKIGFSTSAGANNLNRCTATGGTSAATAAFDLSGASSAVCTYCEAYANAAPGFRFNTMMTFVGCIASAQTNSSNGWLMNGGTYATFVNCVAYGNAGSGFDCTGNVRWLLFTNCIAEANLAWGWNATTVSDGTVLLNCGGYNNTSGNYSTTNIIHTYNFVNNTTGTFFNNPGSGDFSLNSLPNQGSLARAAGFPGLMPRGTSTGYADIGAIQHADPTAATIINRQTNLWITEESGYAPSL